MIQVTWKALKDLKEVPVENPNGDSVPVESIGNICLLNGLRIDRVLNILKFKYNLLSVSRLTKELNCALIFFPDFLYHAGLTIEEADWSG